MNIISFHLPLMCISRTILILLCSISLNVRNLRAAQQPQNSLQTKQPPATPSRRRRKKVRYKNLAKLDMTHATLEAIPEDSVFLSPPVVLSPEIISRLLPQPMNNNNNGNNENRRHECALCDAILDMVPQPLTDSEKHNQQVIASATLKDLSTTLCAINTSINKVALATILKTYNSTIIIGNFNLINKNKKKNSSSLVTPLEDSLATVLTCLKAAKAIAIFLYGVEEVYLPDAWVKHEK